jgi:hypothetical protein
MLNNETDFDCAHFGNGSSRSGRKTSSGDTSSAEDVRGTGEEDFP